MATCFTIAIPTHNRRDTAVLAVRSALAQTRPPEQVLVLCDGCDDGTAEAVRALGSPAVEAIELPKGPGYAYEHRNRALERADGDAILWLADDDLVMPDHLERIGALWDRGDVDLVQSDGVVVRADDTLEWFGSDWSLPRGRARLAATNTNPMTAISVAVEVARAVGGWNAAVARAGDWELWRRVLAAGARSKRSLDPTVLHFRAARRAQPWRDRVAQNAAWLERIGDPAHAATLQDAFVAARSAWEADLIERLSGAEEMIAVLRAERAAAEAQAAAHADTLKRIYAGGWWRLRNRVAPVYRGLRAVRSRL